MRELETHELVRVTYQHHHVIVLLFDASRPSEAVHLALDPHLCCGLPKLHRNSDCGPEDARHSLSQGD